MPATPRRVTLIQRRVTHAVARTRLLPIVLLGLCTTLKTDIGCTAADLVYGQTLRLPAEMIAAPLISTMPDPLSYVTQLREVMRNLRATPTRHHDRHPTDNYKNACHAKTRDIDPTPRDARSGAYQTQSTSPARTFETGWDHGGSRMDF
ncbi:hypothetical protein HPB47_011930 [Ixodes persulcatus]|uniref:Uncharacterized protein n=1 Tax=Ixodes persulcatus TaxID=34615 RepID=A0AC60NV26_IXOPE|nr:hypothetical protein HPB47_011930 [Ixodes persulcatus]